MHARRFVCMLLGMWLAGSALVTWITADSFHAAPRILASHSPEFGVRLQSMSREEARMMLAYPVRQQVGWWTQQWGDVLAPLAVGIFQRTFITPQLLDLGGMLDFAAPNMLVTERGQLEAVRMGFILVEHCNSSRAEFWPCS